MSSFQGKRVSKHWGIVLTDVARRVPVPLNDGQRTMADQRARVRKHGVYDAVRNPHGAAIPSPNAPHIRLGRQDHALDLNMPGGLAVITELRRMGIPMANTVATEPWHWETASARRLREAAVRIDGRARRLHKLTTRYARVRASIRARQRHKIASPGQRRLLKRIRDAIARAR